MRRLLLYSTLLLLAACQGKGASDAPRLAVDWQPTPAADRASLPTVTPFAPVVDDIDLTPETETAAADAAPVEIPTFAPTEVPPGVYIQESNGFTLYYPAHWEIDEETGQFIRMFDPDLGILFGAFTEFIDEDTSLDAMLSELVGDDVEAMLASGTAELIAEESIQHKSGVTIPSKTVLVYDEDGSQVSVWIAYAESGSRFHTFFAFGTPFNIESRLNTVSKMVSQATLGGTTLFGMNRDETLVLLGGDPLARSLDPARTTGSAAGYIGLLYSGLVRLSPQMQIVPDLAESWTVSEDGTVYTFTLREGLQFESGRPLTTADVAYSLERAADPATDSTTAGTYLVDIAGVSEKLAGEADTISGLEVVDERTIILTLDGPKPYFLAKLTYPTSFVVDMEIVDDEDEDWVFAPNASGPFMLQEWREDEAMIFARNEAYHTPPSIPHVVYLFSRVGSRTSLFESGEVDIVQLGTTDAAQVRKPSDPLHDQWVTTTSMCTTFVQLNNAIPPMDDLNVRLALALSVDKEGLLELLSEGMNLQAHTILPPAMPGYSLELSQSQAELIFDPDAAQAALAASSYADEMPPLTLLAGGYGDSERDDLNALVENWREILGVEVTITFIDPENFTEAAHEEEGHIVSYGWCADYPDPENFLDILYHSSGDFNVSNYANPEVDALLEEARTALDPTQRLALYQQAEALLLNDVATIPLQHGVSDALVGSKIKGYVLSPMGAPIVHLLSLEPNAGEE